MKNNYSEESEKECAYTLGKNGYIFKNSIKDFNLKIYLLGICLFFGFLNQAQAQLSAKYTFGAQSTTTMTNISGTSLGSAASDVVATNIPIGFTFAFNCQNYTTIGASPNGFIWFGTGTCSGTQYTPLSSQVGEVGSVNGIISSWGANITSATSWQYLTTGTSPNRVFTVQWINFAPSAGGCDMQIKLFETTNRIQMTWTDYQYGLSGSTTGQTGIRGATPTDFLNRTAPNWCTGTAAGALNTSVSTISGTAGCTGYPSADASSAANWQWTYNSAACCTPPSVQANTGSSANITNTQCDISFTRGNGTGGVLVVARPNATTAVAPTNGTAYTASTNFTSPTSTTGTGNNVVYYGTANGVSAASTPITITNLTPGTTYAFDVYEYNTTSTCYLNPAYTFTVAIPLCLPPSPQATIGAGVSSITSNSATLSWNSGAGTGGEFVILNQGSPVTTDPTQNTSYTANAAFGSGSLIGTGRVVYSGTAQTVNISSLLPNSNYYYSIYTYNSSGPCYKTPAITGSFTTANGSMTYATSGVSQSSTATVTQGAVSQQIVQIQVNTGPGTLPALTMTSISFNTNGSTLTGTLANDITAARIMYNSTNTLSGASQFGSDITTFPGGSTAITVTGSQGLQPNGNNFFFIVYDLNIGATVGNLLDGEITSITFTDGVTPTTTTPSPTTAIGTRAISSMMSLSCAYTTSASIAYSSITALTSPTPTTLVTATATSGAGMIDDNFFSNISIGFNFEFLGQSYNTFGVNANGFIWLGGFVPSAGNLYTPISSNQAYGAIICPFGADLKGNISTTAAGRPKSTISYRVSGTAPNRTLTVQWESFRLFASTGANNNNDRIDFQVILYESNPGGLNSNKVQFSYIYQNPFGLSANNAGGRQVGFRGADNTNFYNRTQASGHWLNTSAISTGAAGTLNTSTANLSSTEWVNVSPGLTLTFSPTVAKPSITPSPTASNTCPSATIDLTGSTSVPASPTWQWYKNGISIPLATSNIYSAPLSGNYIVVAKNGTCGMSSSAVAVTINPCNSITTSDVSAQNCAGGALSVSFNATGTYTSGNVFTAQLSDASGNFGSPVTIGTLSSTSNGTLTINSGPGIIPANTVAGLGYKIRVVASNPAVTGIANNAFEVLEPAPTISIVNPSGGCSPGTVDITASGIVTVTNGVTVSGVTYWNEISASTPFTGNASAVTNTDPSTIYVKYANACGYDVKPINVIFNNPIIASNASSNPTTCAGANGTITLNGLNPSSAYTVVYQKNGPPNINAGSLTSNGSGQIIISSLGDGAYDNFVVTRLGCSSAIYPNTGFIQLSDPAAPSVTSTSSTNPTTCLGTNGSIQLNGLLASTSYNVTYDKNAITTNAGSLSSNGSGEITISGLGEGNYDNIYVTLSGCNSTPVPSSGVIALVPPASPSISSNSPIDPTTCSGSNGSIGLNGLANSTLYTLTYTKNGSPVNAGSISTNGSGVLTLSGITSGTYSNFVVTNALGCVSSAYPSSGNITLTDPPIPTISSFIANDPLTCSGANGSIALGGLLNSTTYGVTYRRNNGAIINGGNISTNGSGSLTIPSLLQGDYDNIIITTNNCSSDPYPISGSIALVDPPLPILATGNSVDVCGSSIVILSASDAAVGEDYNWYSGPTGNNLIQSGGSSFSTPNISTTTNYYVTIFNTTTGCESISRTIVTATIFAKPTAIISGSLLSCASTVLSSSSSIAGSGSISNRQWQLNGVPIAFANGINYTASISGNYTVIISNSNGCTTTSSISNAVVTPAATAIAGGTTNTCEGVAVTISGATASNGSILWTHNGQGVITAGTETTIAPIYTTSALDAGNTVTLTMTVTPGSPCSSAIATYTINVKARPVVSMSPNNSTICNDGNGVFRTLSIVSPQANTNYIWSPIQDLYIDPSFSTPYTGDSRTTIYAVPFVTTNYSVTATSTISGCTTGATNASISVCSALTNSICQADAVAPIVPSTTPVYLNYSLTGATASPGIPCAPIARDVYFRVVVPSTGELHIITAPGTNAIANLNVQSALVSIHYSNGGDCTTSPLLTCNSEGAAGLHAYASASGLIPGQIAYIRLASTIAGNALTAQYVRMAVLPALMWTGITNNNFSNPANWFGGDATSLTFPTANKSVIIRSVASPSFAPIVTGNQTCNGLIMNSTATLSIGNLATLNIKGDVSPNNCTIAGNGWAILSGTVAQNITTAGRLNWLRVNNSLGIKINAPVRVGGLDLQLGPVTTNNNLTILSDAGITGYVNDFSPGYTGTSSGNINMERRVVASGMANHYISYPLNTTGTVYQNYSDDFSVSGTTGYVYNTDPTAPQPGSFPTTWYYDETLTNPYTPGWKNAAQQVLNKGQGISASISGTNVFDVSGTLYSGGFSFPITYTDNGFNLFGNPYSSPISFNQLYSANSSVIYPSFYIWNPVGSNYAAYNGVVWTNNPAGATSSDVIGHSQSIFVLAQPGGGSLTVNPSIRTINQAANFFTETPPLIRLQVSADNKTDEAVLYIQNSASGNFDGFSDSRKMVETLPGSVSIFTLSDDNMPLAINATDKLNSESIIPLQIVNDKQGIVIIKLNISDLKGQFEEIYLEDVTLNKFIDLKNDESYTTQLSAGNSGSRFFLHFSKPVIKNTIENDLTIYSNKNMIFLNLPNEGSGQIELLDVLGKKIFTQIYSGKSGRISFEVPNALNGTYLVKVTNNGKNFSQKVVIIE